MATFTKNQMLKMTLDSYAGGQKVTGVYLVKVKKVTDYTVDWDLVEELQHDGVSTPNSGCFSIRLSDLMIAEGKIALVGAK